MTSYNVGGKTVIIAEDLRSYGFNVIWDGTKRTLSITDIKGPVTSNATKAPEGAIGAVAGSYYHTDIVTYFEGKVIESYNLNGLTVIPATALRDFGYEVIWDGDNRKVYIDANKNGGNDFAGLKIKANQSYHGSLSLVKEPVHFNGSRLVTSDSFYIETGLDKRCYVPVKAIADALGIKYTWDSTTSTLTVTVPKDADIKPATELRNNSKKYGTLEYEIKDIEFNVVNGDKTHKNLNAVLYGSTVLVDIKDLATAFDFFCVNEVDIYTQTMMYLVYSGMFQGYQN